MAVIRLSRWATRKQQSYNRHQAIPNTSGRKGVYWKKHHKKWAVSLKIDGKDKHFGYFKEFDDAVAAIDTIEQKIKERFL